MGIGRYNKQSQIFTSAATVFTLPAYAVPAGSSRVLTVRANGLRTNDADFTLSCTFGGTPVPVAVSGTQSTTGRWYRTSLFVLVAPAETTADIVVTASTSIRGLVIEVETLHGAAQTGTVGATATNGATPTAELLLAACSSNSLILAAVGSDSGSLPTWTWTTAMEDYDLNEGTNDTTEIAGSGAGYETSGGDVTITSARSGSSRPQVAVAAEIKAVPTGGTAIPVIFDYYARLRAE